MSGADYSKLEIASEYLELAMQLYLEKRNYFCAIHLAGAAEELFGMHLPKDKRIFNIARKAQKALRIIETAKVPQNAKEHAEADREATQLVNWSKNTIKHLNDDKTTITIDPVFEASRWIEQALINYYKLHLPKSSTLWKFEDYRNKEIQRQLRPRL